MKPVTTPKPWKDIFKLEAEAAELYYASDGKCAWQDLGHVQRPAWRDEAIRLGKVP